MTECRTNADAIQEAEQVQQSTKAALYRIQQSTQEAQEVGEGTLEELREQRTQMERIHGDADNLNAQLENTKKLQNEFDRWAGNWRGYHKKLPKAEANQKIAASQRARVASGKENKSLASTKNETSPKQSSRPQSKVIKRPPKRTDLVSNDLAHPHVANLDGDSKAGLERLASTDSEIDAMLDQTSQSLDRLMNLSVSMRQENAAQIKDVDKLASTLDKANSTQAVINVRARRHLVGRWLKRAEAP